MKRLPVILVAAGLVLGLSACSSEGDSAAACEELDRAASKWAEATRFYEQATTIEGIKAAYRGSLPYVDEMAEVKVADPSISVPRDELVAVLREFHVRLEQAESENDLLEVAGSVIGPQEDLAAACGPAAKNFWGLNPGA